MTPFNCEDGLDLREKMLEKAIINSVENPRHCLYYKKPGNVRMVGILFILRITLVKT
jgi:hypothetical protein